MPKRKPESEKDTESYVCERAEALGGEAYKFVSPQRANVPDRLVILPAGVVFFIEVKSEGEPAKDAQLREHARLRKLGQCVFVCDTKTSVDAAFSLMV